MSSAKTCLLLIPRMTRLEPIRRIIERAAASAGVTLILADLAPSLFDEPDPDIAIADVSLDPVGRDAPLREQLTYIRRAGRTVLLLDSKSPPPLWLSERDSEGLVIYENTPAGRADLQIRFNVFFSNWLADPLAHFPSGSQAAPLVDFDSLTQQAFENLCFELLNELGFRRVEWAKKLPDVDIVATLPKRDPDGFEYQELWLIFVRSARRFGKAMNAVFARGLLDRVTKEANLAGATVLEQSPVTMLFVPFHGKPSVSEIQKYYDVSRTSRPSLAPRVRLRIWDEEEQMRLVRNSPVLAYKYFAGDRQSSRASDRTSYERILTENKKLQAQMKKTLGELRKERSLRAIAERDAIWKELSFTAAHKLGNPVFAIETDLDTLGRQVAAGDGTSALQIITDMGESVEKAKLIIEQFKSLTRAQQIERQSLDIRTVVIPALRIANQAGAAATLDIDPETPLMSADPQRLTECFDELIANALKHGSERVELRVEVAPAAKPLPVELPSAEKYVRIRVSDNGPGIPPDQKDLVFAPFVTTHAHGTGLGLAVVRRIVEGHNGLIREVGQLGMGACFELYLPVAPQAAA
jgi:signal transduction histidine kinase